MKAEKPTVIKTVYRETEIIYDERENQWQFTLRGRERSETSLRRAKEAIDKPPPKHSKPFKKFEAWIVHGGDREPELATVTSLVDRTNRWGGGKKLRVTIGKSSREESLNDVFPRTVPNDEIVRQIIASLAEETRLGEIRHELHNKLTRCKIETEEPEES